MGIRVRRLIYLTFILLFLLAAPILIFYTAGYRYNWQKSKVEQTGVLLMDVKPAEAKITLNRMLQSAERPLRLASLPPNYYLLRTEKEGYFPWQKNLEVKAKESILLYDIVLFKQNSPLLLDNGQIQTLSLSPREDKIIYLDNNKVKIFSLKDEKAITLFQTSRPNQQTDLSWSENGNFILLKESQVDKNYYTVLDINNSQEFLPLEQITSLNFNDLLWHPRENYLLYGLANGNLYKINLNTQKTEKIAEQIDSFNWNDSDLYFIQSQAETALRRRLLTGQEEIARLPKGQYRLIAGRNNYLTAIEPQQKQIYLIDLKDKKQPILKLDGWQAVWGQGEKNNYLIYYDDSELWLFDPKTKKSSLISRFSSNLRAAFPLPQIPYYLMQIDNSLRLTELDDRDQRNTETIFTGKDIKDVFIDKKAKNIYFLDRIKDKVGMFRLEIQ